MDKAVVKALKVMEALSTSDRPRGVTELARDLGLTKANVHRILGTLASHGYVSRNEVTTRYTLSMKLWELGSRSVKQVGLGEIAGPHLRALLAETGESVHLAVLDRGNVVYIDKADSDIPPLRAVTLVGRRMPAYCVSVGKALLAFSRGGGVAALEFPLNRYTPDTLVDRAKLDAHFARIRSDGYAVNRGEWRTGVWGIAAPIIDASGDAIAAVGVWGLESRLRESLPKLAKDVVGAAAAISSALMHGNPEAVAEPVRSAAPLRSRRERAASPARSTPAPRKTGKRRAPR